jgi:hypothetical protein
MAYKTKLKKGRPKVHHKERSVYGITPEGFEYDHFDDSRKKIIYKKKS